MSCTGPTALTPISSVSTVALPATGTISQVAAGLAFNIYGDPSSSYYSVSFLSGAADQVAYTYRKLGGEVLDIELTACQVYTCYEEAVLEWSSILNIHQAKNVLSNILGSPTGTFDHDGKITSSEIHSSSHISLKYPKFEFSYARRVAEGISGEVGIGGYNTFYSASFNLTASVQDYDLQTIISASSATDSTVDYYGKVTDNKIIVHKIYWQSPLASWRFFSSYAGLGTVGNLSNYGQYANSSTFQFVPVWQEKLQAQAFEDALCVRGSQGSFEIRNNKLRIFPIPVNVGGGIVSPDKMWIVFSVPGNSYEQDVTTIDIGINGVNNLGTAPFDPIPFENINSIGKHWIRRYALACSKEILGQIRGKFLTVPIPGNDVTLNWSELLNQAATEKKDLREELIKMLEDLTYLKLSKDDAELVEASSKVIEKIPSPIFVG